VLHTTARLAQPAVLPVGLEEVNVSPEAAELALAAVKLGMTAVVLIVLALIVS
jgi:hypothetical protein